MIWLGACIGVPLLALLALRWPALWHRGRALGWVLCGALLGGWAWDALAVRLGAWYYDQANLVGLWLGGLPIEEWIWIIGVTLLFGCLTIVLEEPTASRT